MLVHVYLNNRAYPLTATEFNPGREFETASKPANPSSTASKAVGVLHLINGEHYSGAERVQDLLGETLPRLGYQPGFVCLKDGLFPEQRQSKSCALHVETMSSKLDLKAIGRIVTIAKDGNYQLLHAHTPRTLMVGRMVARKTGLPLVYHVHSPVGRDSTRGLHNKINQWVENWSLKQSDAMICVSRSLHEYMRNSGHPKQKLHVVPNGVKATRYLQDRRRPRSPWRIGTTALFRPRKGTEMLLEALAKLDKSGASVKLLAVGAFESEKYEREIRELAHALKIEHLIEWAGFQSDVDPFFQKMDLFVLPSLFGEGLPMVILEAMANGVPVVAADVEGVSEAIRDQRDGLIFEPGNVDELVEQIQLMMSARFNWNVMRELAWERQKESFSDGSMAEGVAQVYRQLLKRDYAANGK